MSQKREYLLYSMDRFALHLTNRFAVARGYVPRWELTVYAGSIKQAYYLAHRHLWAAGPGQVGLLRIELDPGMRGDLSEADARAQGLIQLAPYFGRASSPAAGMRRLHL